MATAQRLHALREIMSARQYDALIIPRADEYLGEYLPEHNERLLWATGFTGSAGMAIVLKGGAAIFVDGRYTVQVRDQVDETLFAYHHFIDEPPVTWLGEQLGEGAKVVCDPRLHSLAWFEQAKKVLARAGCELVADADNLIDNCWDDRPAPLVKQALLHQQQYTGEHSRDKRARLGERLKQQKLDAALIFAPDSVSWLLNIRGRDVPTLPIVQSFALLYPGGELSVFVDPARIPEGFAEHVGDGVTVYAEQEAEAALTQLGGKNVLADPNSANAWTQLLLREGGATLVAGEDLALFPKACKNAVEIEGARQAHIRDGVAEVKFLHWLDSEVEAGRLHNEALLADKLGAFRAEQALYQEPSFDTISAAGGNAAMPHYNHLNNPNPPNLSMDSIYLVDSGGQYLDGTTDITRTVAIGRPDEQVKQRFTLVLKGHIALDVARFPAGTNGGQLDVLARQFLWAQGLDFDHGTGHGVGSFLSVHEAPQRIAKRGGEAVLYPGMILSNEPGYYKAGQYGIRCENLVVVTPPNDDETPMMGFEVLTMVPFDQRLIDVSLLSQSERNWVDRYHQQVYDTLSPLLDGEVLAWLTRATKPLAG
ncbi:MAG: X-Pro aminopeptidase [Gammaproteobacteria bacterium]|nr:MAG: X-Pro aminopeptidase [Gammaproteobacteria bacterium]